SSIVRLQWSAAFEHDICPVIRGQVCLSGENAAGTKNINGIRSVRTVSQRMERSIVGPRILEKAVRIEVGTSGVIRGNVSGVRGDRDWGGKIHLLPAVGRFARESNSGQ